MNAKVEAVKEKKVIPCAVYTRVSTDMQAEVEFNSCEAQEDRIRAFVASQEGFEVFKVYTDPGFSGANMNRPGLKQLINDIRMGLVTMVITYKIDRLTRSPRDFYELIEFFEQHQASFISVTERFDTSTPSGRLLRNIMLTFAQFERELASERVKDKVIQRVNRGLYHGGHPPYGYRAENGALVLDPPRDAAVKRIFEQYVKTRSLRAVIHDLRERGIVSRKGKKFCDAAVWGMLKKEVYTGKVVHKGKAFPGQHPAIISNELFQHVHDLITKSPRRQPEAHSWMPFAGIVQCADCRSTMCVAYTNKRTKSGVRKYYYYRCAKVIHDGSTALKNLGASKPRGGGIRTPGGLSPTAVFKTAALNRSATPPKIVDSSGRPRFRDGPLRCRKVLPPPTRRTKSVASTRPPLRKLLILRGGLASATAPSVVVRYSPLPRDGRSPSLRPGHPSENC
jgi:site-specific DNA recombinase